MKKKRRKVAPRPTKRATASKSDLLIAALERGDFSAAVKLSALQPKKQPTAKRKPAARAKPQRKPRKPTPSQQAVASRRAALRVAPPKPRKAPKRPKAPAGLTPAQKARQRARHESAKRGAAVRAKPHKRITSKSKRRTTAKLPVSPTGRKEIAFEFSDILSGRNPSNPQLREQYDKSLAKYVGKDIQVTFRIGVSVAGAQRVPVRVRRIIRNFTGRLDIASLANSAIRDAMGTLGSDGALFIESVSVQEFSE